MVTVLLMLVSVVFGNPFNNVGFITQFGPISGSYEHGYILYTDGNQDTLYEIKFSEDTTTDFVYEHEPLFLKYSTVALSDLEAYYASKPEPWKTYLIEAAKGNEPFAFVDKGGYDEGIGRYNQVFLYDGAVYSILSAEVPMRVPGDYPCGEYVVASKPKEGEEEKLIEFKMIVVGPSCDYDIDGVLDVQDLCLGTTRDMPDVSLGVNRHVWYSGDYFTTLMPEKKKNTFTTVNSIFKIADTYGCSCEQILDVLVEKTGFNFEGHYKYGCSKSIIEDWIAGKYYIGPTYLETVEVPTNSNIPVQSINTLETDKNYFLKAYGIANAGDTIDFDAKYSITNRILGDTWTDTVSGYESYGPSLLDLFVDNINVDWGAYNNEHRYQIPYAGTGNPVSLVIYDIYYPNNVGSLYVDIIEDKWVSLW